MKRFFTLVAALAIGSLLSAQEFDGQSCTSIMVGRKASNDGSVMTSHTCDGRYRTWVQMEPAENQIIVYQPNETVRLDVRLENETVWLTQAQLCDLFGVVKSNVSYHLKNIFGTNELDYGATVQKIRTVRTEAGRKENRRNGVTA